MHISCCEDCACRHTCYKYNNVKDGISGWDDYFDEDCDCEYYFKDLPCNIGDSVLYSDDPVNIVYETGKVLGYNVSSSGLDLVIDVQGNTIFKSIDLIGTNIIITEVK